MLLAAWMGGEFGGEWIHVIIGMAEILCCSPETITTLLIKLYSNNKKFIRKGSGQYQMPSRGQVGMRSRMRPLSWIKSEASFQRPSAVGINEYRQ